MRPKSTIKITPCLKNLSQADLLADAGNVAMATRFAVAGYRSCGCQKLGSIHPSHGNFDVDKYGKP